MELPRQAQNCRCFLVRKASQPQKECPKDSCPSEKEAIWSSMLVEKGTLPLHGIT